MWEASDVEVVLGGKSPNELPDGNYMRSDPILLIGQPSFSGLVYPRPMIEAIVAEFNTGKLPLFGGIGSLTDEGNTRLNLTMMSHIVTKLEVRDDELWATVQTLDTPRGTLARQLISESSDSIALRACGNGTISEDGKTVESYVLTSVDLINLADGEQDNG